MREIKFIVLHCTATQLEATPAAIQRYWRAVLGWQNPGYHLLIEPNGAVYQLQPFELLANGVKGLNPVCIHLSYIGGIDRNGKAADTRTEAQKHQMALLIERLLIDHPRAKVAGHYQFASKACPSFNVPRWLETLGIPLSNIHRTGKAAPVQSW